MPVVVSGEPASFDPVSQGLTPDGIHVLDGSYVLNVGELRVNITNHGLIGSQYSAGMVYSHAASGEWPGGSGNEYLWGAGLWIGGRIGGELSVTTGQYDCELRPSDRLADTIYEARQGILLRPTLNEFQTGMRLPAANADDDHDGSYDEDYLNGLDDDGDGQVDEDFGQLGDQMFTCTMYDNLTLIQQIYPEHRPLGVRVVQRAIGWDRELRENVVGLDFDITNVGYNVINDMYLGFYVDCDIQRRTAGANQPDDRAGFFSGMARGEDGVFYRTELAYMWDGAEEDPLPGYFGAQMVNHTCAFDGVSAPLAPKITSFNIFATKASVHQDGEPISDIDRYYVMSKKTFDRNSYDDESGDLKFLITSGPFNPLKQGKTLDYEIALIVASGFRDLMTTAAEAGRLYAGRWVNADNNWATGWGGKETKVCLGDYPPGPFGDDPILNRRYNFANDSCTGGYWVMFQPVVRLEHFMEDENGNLCVWVNADNCEECLRSMGRECDDIDFFEFLRRYPIWAYPSRYTGISGRETHYPWTIPTETPPLAPRARIMTGDMQVEILWDDRSEVVPDPFRGVSDFESYRIWRVGHWVPPGDQTNAAAPPDAKWGLVAEYDLINEVPAGISISGQALPLGKNTGLDNILYEPACLRDPQFAGLADAMQALVDSDPYGFQYSFPSIRQRDGGVAAGMEAFVRWETASDVLDTFFAVAERIEDPSQGIIGKRPTSYYHYVDTELHNGFTYYHAVVARDHNMAWDGTGYVPSGTGIEEDPGNHFYISMPRPEAQTVADRQETGNNIYVYPNPATREALAEFQRRDRSTSDPTGVRVMFNNLPLAHNTIKIYTVAGDLLQTLHHDGFANGGSISWNLMTRNRQEIVSGIYLYAVHSDIGGFDPFHGRFVVIR